MARPTTFKVNGVPVEMPVLPTSAGEGRYYLYAVHPELGVAYLQTSYRHTVTAEYECCIARWNEAKVDHYGGHPRASGVTAKNGWAICADQKEGR